VAQVARAGMLAAIAALAVLAHLPRQPLAHVAGGRLEFLRLLGPPPAGPGIAARQRRGTDVLRSRIAGRHRRTAAHAVLAPMLAADQLPTRVTARDRVVPADVAFVHGQ